MTWAQLLLTAALCGAALSAIMAVAWGVQQRLGSSRFVDAFWSFGVGVVAASAAILPFGGVFWRQAAVAGMALTWCLRLGGHIADRNRGTHDDPRYAKMQDDWGVAAPRRMFLFLQAQAAVGLVLVLSVALAAQNPNPTLRLQDIAGGLLLLVGMVGEAIADRQLRHFGRRQRGGVCQNRLWRWSRHPNYFFEWLTWLAYPLIAFDASAVLGALAFTAPILMYWTLVHVSGIPPLEEHMLRTRGEAYRNYMLRTSAFFPLPSRH